MKGFAKGGPREIFAFQELGYGDDDVVHCLTAGRCDGLPEPVSNRRGVLNNLLCSGFPEHAFEGIQFFNGNQFADLLNLSFYGFSDIQIRGEGFDNSVTIDGLENDVEGLYWGSRQRNANTQRKQNRHTGPPQRKFFHHYDLLKKSNSARFATAYVKIHRGE